MKVKNAPKELGVNEAKLNEWITKLNEFEAIALTKSIFGGVELKLKKDADVALVQEKIEAERVREEIKRMRGDA